MAHGRTYMDMHMHMYMYMCMLYMCMSIAAVAAKPRSLPADAGVSVRRHMLDISVRRQVQYEDNKSSSERCWESRWRAASSDREAVSVACRAKFVFVTATRSNLSFQLTLPSLALNVLAGSPGGWHA